MKSDTNMANPEELQTFKIVIIGDSNIGKTSLAYRLCTGKFYEKLETTIGVDFFEKIVNINDDRVRVSGILYKYKPLIPFEKCF